VTVLQVTPTQSALVAQVVAHWTVLMASHLLYRPHEVTMAAGQLPAPLHVAAAVSLAAVVAVPGVHDRLRHPWVLPKTWQRAVPAALVAVLFPAQRPSSPHVVGSATAVQAVAGSGSAAPAAMAVQVPTDPGTRHDSQVPEHAVLQQTPGLPSVR
jgi:hypothetical protein